MDSTTLRANAGKSMLSRCPRRDRAARMRLGRVDREAIVCEKTASNANQTHAIEPFAQRLASETNCNPKSTGNESTQSGTEDEL